VSIAAQLAAVRARVDAACARAGRSPSDVTLLAVSKLQPEAAIREAYGAGQRQFGENYAQELRDKAKSLALPGLQWHAIGSLQDKNAKYVAKVAHAFHALDRAGLADELDRRREGLQPLACYVEVNLAAEPSKGGVTPGELKALLAHVRSRTNLRLAGLMALPPLEEEPEAARRWFRALRTLAEGEGLSGLSMGTTSDYELAVEEGATVVRVGTALFGERPPRR
jgi:pyridoxal phosphate enzyme (YggS family)